MATSGLKRPEDLDDFVDFSYSPPRHRTKGIFHGVDQGLCDHLFPRRAQEGVWSLGRAPCAWWARGEEAAGLERRDIFEGPCVPRMIHWAGTQLPVLRRQPRADILTSYEAMYVAATLRTWAQRTLEHLSTGLRWAVWRGRSKLAYALRRPARGRHCAAP